MGRIDAGIGGHGQNAGHRCAQKGTTGSWEEGAGNPSSKRVRCAFINASDGKIVADFVQK
jgi:hypothetical protein